ncbi:hypothetical protein BC938DRAFT_477228 [Jimgerdemannia flammicorona]|uniref:Coiled-coil domain-containing protein 43 n=1 Tax=Jimgerdemannia flammicorona TaxID=994334 RepID=A0A433PB64_9FUNG|nr:hypothetical protein BC938DRAFT_477228 [Jimgerdemannia flammicorona]
MSLIDLITERLATIDLHDETVSEYIAGIVQEEWLEEHEKREAITEYLKETTVREAPTNDLIDDMFIAWRKEQAEIMRKEEDKKAKATESAPDTIIPADPATASGTAGPAKRTTVWDNIEQPESTSFSQRHQRRDMSKEERAKRDQLLAQYGYQLDEVIEGANGEAEIVYKDHAAGAGGKGTGGGEDLLGANRNADIIKDKERARREQMRKKSEEEKERNKMLLEKQRLAADKEKKRTAKKEKRRM